MNVLTPGTGSSIAPRAFATVGDVVPVLLSGGSGSRLWPVSRASFPKQFWPLISDRSMIEETARRALGEGFAPPIVVCNQEHRFLVAEELRRAGWWPSRTPTRCCG
jgi:mannose-1-phosphate guanylyltransferase